MRLLSRLEYERLFGARWATYFVRIPYFEDDLSTSVPMQYRKGFFSPRYIISLSSLNVFRLSTDFVKVTSDGAPYAASSVPGARQGIRGDEKV